MLAFERFRFWVRDLLGFLIDSSYIGGGVSGLELWVYKRPVYKFTIMFGAH